MVVVPGAVLLLAPPRHPAEIAAVALATLACVGFLLIGTLYWRALSQCLAGADRRVLNKALSMAHRLEKPLLAMTGLAAAAVVAAISVRGLTWPVMGAAVLTLLAGLEYVNYYHRQLQHFDRWSDFKLLVTSRRLRRSHMARHLASYRTSSKTDLP